MSQRLSDLTSYKGVLPYDSELFGVYQPLLGWKSARQVHRNQQGTRARRSDVLSRLSDRVQPSYTAEFGQGDEPVRVKDLHPGGPVEVGFDGAVMTFIKEQLPTEAKYTDAVWDDLLSTDALTKILAETVPDRASQLFRELSLGTDGAALYRRGAQVSPEATVRTFIGKESKVAGVLSDLHQAKMHDVLHDVFYGSLVNKNSLVLAAANADPFDTIDPTHELDRVGLSPIGLADLFREDLFELDTFLGTPVGHVWVAPGSTVEMAEVHTPACLPGADARALGADGATQRGHHHHAGRHLRAV